MTEVSSSIESVSKHILWNKGKIVGAKPPLRPKPAVQFAVRAGRFCVF